MECDIDMPYQELHGLQRKASGGGCCEFQDSVARVSCDSNSSSEVVETISCRHYACPRLQGFRVFSLSYEGFARYVGCLTPHNVAPTAFEHDTLKPSVNPS